MGVLGMDGVGKAALATTVMCQVAEQVDIEFYSGCDEPALSHETQATNVF